MRVSYLHLAVAAWLVASTWLFENPRDAWPITAGGGVLVAVLALASERRARLRFGISLVAAALFVAALFLPELPGAERLNLMLVAPLLLSLSFFAPDPGRVARTRAAARGIKPLD